METDSSGTLYLIDSVNFLQLWKTVDKGENYNTNNGDFANINTYIIPGNGRDFAHGVEFNRLGTEFYVSVGNTIPDVTDGIYNVNIASGIISKISNTEKYSNTMLEMGWDGNIYAAGYCRGTG